MTTSSFRCPQFSPWWERAGENKHNHVQGSIVGYEPTEQKGQISCPFECSVRDGVTKTSGRAACRLDRWKRARHGERRGRAAGQRRGAGDIAPKAGGAEGERMLCKLCCRGLPCQGGNGLSEITSRLLVPLLSYISDLTGTYSGRNCQW